MAITSQEPRPTKILPNGDLLLWDGRIAPTYGHLLQECNRRGLKLTDLAPLTNSPQSRFEVAASLAKLQPTDWVPWEQTVALYTKWFRSSERRLCGLCESVLKDQRANQRFCSASCKDKARAKRRWANEAVNKARSLASEPLEQPPHG
jgi:hypothetical protein